ncbi:Alpha/beta hydrolase fold-3 domain protein [Methylocella silvestris BL2]|uniref:Alpha/beta hydrolase fold-3 domain protein n=1 Tax=Methylocella silvestris (strain DSM 15510 / CIP 108128 / LMG 27833 / NCIMB 13906 / BL2) TaxID=395965 RepID=B8ENA8_METSB|nr:alpha/beta hydrolase [Methylocella silvestris]ACK49621.1 Alpha/beta hydrolase fold-3 domain protein [Methylocella silvestris BL2]
MISAPARQFWTFIHNSPRLFSLPLDMRRRAAERSEGMTSEPRGVAFAPAPDVHGLWAEPPEARPGAAILYFHGGGYVCGSPKSRRKTLGHLALACAARALAPAYRLAPEHPFPAALEDGVFAYQWLLAQGAEPARTVIAGDSAGGGLALATMLAARDKGLPPCAGLVLMSPWTDLSLSGESFDSRASTDITCSRAALGEMAGWILAGADARAPLASPLFADLTGLPPIFALVGGDEVLLDDTIALIRKAAHAGVDAFASVAAGMQHVYPIWSGVFPEADEAIASIGDWVIARTE